jgi:hypothetical protein
MSFSISKFKSTMDKYGGPAKANLFEVTIAKYKETNSAIDPSTEFSFFCNRVNFPGIGVETSSMTNVAQLPTTFPLSMSSAPINATFMIDSNHEMLSFFHNWIQRVMNYSTKGGAYGAVEDFEDGGIGMLPYELGYKDEYGCRMSIKHYSTESFGKNDKFYEVVLDNAWPYQVSDMSMDWALNDQFLTIDVTFAYDRIHYSGDRQGNPSNRIQGGLLDTLSDLANFVDVTKSTLSSGKPTSIQDAINKLSRVRNSYNNIDAFFGDSGEGVSEDKPPKIKTPGRSGAG